MIKANYTVTLKDIKRVSSEAVKKVSLFKKRRIIFSLIFPFIILLFPLLPFISNGWGPAIVAIPIVMIYMYFYGYGRRMYTSVKATRYRHSPKIIPMSVELTEDNIIVEQEFIKEKFTSDSFLTSMETNRYYVLFFK
ncbi:MAG: hypothetical protein L0L86_11400, partial [Lactococcus lactis]|nr:hypothetical protein [Lactococcus lactis]